MFTLYRIIVYVQCERNRMREYSEYIFSENSRLVIFYNQVFYNVTKMFCGSYLQLTHTIMIMFYEVHQIRT